MRKALLRFAPALGVALVLAGTAPAATDAQIDRLVYDTLVKNAGPGK